MIRFFTCLFFLFFFIPAFSQQTNQPAQEQGQKGSISPAGKSSGQPKSVISPKNKKENSASKQDNGNAPNVEKITPEQLTPSPGREQLFQNNEKNKSPNK